jgi:hypothetical protein
MGSGFKTFTAGAVLTASDVNNYLMEQGVMYFATTAARDLAITSPEDGMVAYVGSNDANEGIYTYNGTAWRKGPGWNAPWGVIGYSKQTVAQTGIAAITDITGDGPSSKASVTFTAIGNRYYKLTARVVSQSASAPSTSVLYITDSSNVEVGRSVEPTAAAVYGNHHFTSAIVTPAAGSITYKLRIEPVTANLDTIYTAASPGFLLIEDIGPSGAPT